MMFSALKGLASDSAGRSADFERLLMTDIAHIVHGAPRIVGARNANAFAHQILSVTAVARQIDENVAISVRPFALVNQTR